MCPIFLVRWRKFSAQSKYWNVQALCKMMQRISSYQAGDPSTVENGNIAKESPDAEDPVHSLWGSVCRSRLSMENTKQQANILIDIV